MKRLKKIASSLLCVVGLFGWFSFAYADMQYSHEQLSQKFRVSEETYAPHLQALWMVHLENSPTVVLALNKLEEKSGKKLKNKEKNSWRANFLRGMLQAGAFGASAALGSAVPLIGARAIGAATAPDKLKAHLDAVTGADMVGLAKQIEDEQANLLTNYLNLRQALEAQQSAQSQLDVMQRMGSDLPQTDGNKLAQYFALNELTARRLAEAESVTENARTALMMMSNRDVVIQVEEQIQAQLSDKNKPVL